ncbi:MAG: hypothetical protein J5486_11485 [Bacteroidaceae bacterium]|nr:hypothetical protein [Bacteroidaceae bacterium]
MYVDATAESLLQINKFHTTAAIWQYLGSRVATSQQTSINISAGFNQHLGRFQLLPQQKSIDFTAQTICFATTFRM